LLGKLAQLFHHGSVGVDGAIVHLSVPTLDVNSSSLQQESVRKVPGNYLQGGVEGKFRETVQITMHLTFPCELGRLHVSSLKLAATGRWGNVPGKVQISLQSHPLPNMGEHTSVPGNFPQRGDGRYFLERFKSRCISQSAKYGRSNVSSGKLPATGRWRNVPGNVQISMHLTYL
jgi:hypothetical protein